MDMTMMHAAAVTVALQVAMREGLAFAWRNHGFDQFNVYSIELSDRHTGHSGSMAYDLREMSHPKLLEMLEQRCYGAIEDIRDQQKAT